VELRTSGAAAGLSRDGQTDPARDGQSDPVMAANKTTALTAPLAHAGHLAVFGRFAGLDVAAGRDHVGAVRVGLQMRGIEDQRLFYLHNTRREVVPHLLEPGQLP
jgi:hypothetical protein